MASFTCTVFQARTMLLLRQGDEDSSVKRLVMWSLLTHIASWVERFGK